MSTEADAIPMHYVCTIEEARALLAGREKAWVAVCGCREAKGQCARSRRDVCLWFDEVPEGYGERRSIGHVEIDALLAHAEEKRLVPRPFRGETDRSRTNGICFCCDDCCTYFLDPEERCDKGRKIERTQMDSCTNCGDCVPSCHFHARRMDGAVLKLSRDACYGCGLCAAVCPEECVQMVAR